METEYHTFPVQNWSLKLPKTSIKSVPHCWEKTSKHSKCKLCSDLPQATEILKTNKRQQWQNWAPENIVNCYEQHSSSIRNWNMKQTANCSYLRKTHSWFSNKSKPVDWLYQCWEYTPPITTKQTLQDTYNASYVNCWNKVQKYLQRFKLTPHIEQKTEHKRYMFQDINSFIANNNQHCAQIQLRNLCTWTQSLEHSSLAHIIDQLYDNNSSQLTPWIIWRNIFSKTSPKIVRKTAVLLC